MRNQPCIIVLLIVYALLSCNHEAHVEVQKLKIEDVALQETEEVVDPPPPNLTSPYNTIQDWLLALCKTEKPSDPVTTYQFGLFESQDSYTLVLTGSTHYDTDQGGVTRITFAPAAMYFPLPQSKYKNLKREQVLDTITAQLNRFIKSNKFKHSFFAKAKAIVTDFNGNNLVDGK